MSKSMDNLLNLVPMEDYKSPNLPTYREDKPNLTRKLPTRWKNKIMAITTLGLLTVCSFRDRSLPQGCRFHHGGLVNPPSYVAYLTEQEAFEIIRSQLEDTGLSFSRPLQSYDIELDSRTTVERVFISEEADVRIAFVDSWWGELEAKSRAEFVETANAQFEEDFGVTIDAFFFFNRSRIDQSEWQYDEFRIEQCEGFRIKTEDDLVGQIQDFVQQLQEDGIIE